MEEKISPEKAPRQSPKTAILDCTLRDGGAMNASRFSDKTARAVYDACAGAGIDYVEVGYKNSRRFFDPAVYGDWRFCDESALRRVFGENPRPIKLAVMADAGKSDYRDSIPRRSESIVSLVRVATYARGLGEALDIVKHAADMGYETSVNLMATSSLSDAELDDAFGLCAESDAGIVYMMDSFGALTPRAFDNVFSRCLAAARGRGKRVGVHIHDNRQLAFANTISAIRGGRRRYRAWRSPSLSRRVYRQHVKYFIPTKTFF
ncbi:MAG: hypothetical protein IJI37_03380, partial [Opitutales bacterium]|nr:hypothetical protein [Opitutales bacterium]